jgi:hypothetical protein
METTKLEKTGACKEAIFYVRTQKNYEEAWNNCPRGDWMLWIAAKLQIDKRLLTLTKGKCAATVLRLMKDKRSKKAVKAAIDYGHGLIGDEELKNAADAAYAAADAAYAAADAAANAAYAVDTDAAREKNLQETADICRELLTEEVFNKWNNLRNINTVGTTEIYACGDMSEDAHSAQEAHKSSVCG